MPQTTRYGFEYESPQSLPGVSLTSGPNGGIPILAQQVESVIANLEARIEALETTGFRHLTTVYFTTGGTFLKGDYDGFRAARVRMVGGGGGGGGAATTDANWAAGGGGAGGTYAESFLLDAAIGVSIPVTIGAGGAGGVGFDGGATGGESSFGTLVEAAGGNGGVSEQNLDGEQGVNGGTGVNTGVGDIIIPGGDGDNAMSDTNAMIINMPTGGESVLGPRTGCNASTGGVDGTSAAPYGGGGSGAFNDANEGATRTGGNGSDGIVIVDVFV